VVRLKPLREEAEELELPLQDLGAIQQVLLTR
jgi:hypothetical protein